MNGAGLGGFGDDAAAASTAPLVSPEEAAAATAATAELIARATSKTPGEADIADEIAAAAAWANEQAKPWYKKTATWTWIIGGAGFLGLSYWFYRSWQSYRRVGHA